MDGVLSRITLLEALVSRLIAEEGKNSRSEADADAEEGLQEAYSQVTGERNQLQQDKELLNGQVLELQMRLAELGQEAETLRQKPCLHAHTSAAAHSHRPASGTYPETEEHIHESIISCFFF